MDGWINGDFFNSGVSIGGSWGLTQIPGGATQKTSPPRITPILEPVIGASLEKIMHPIAAMDHGRMGGDKHAKSLPHKFLTLFIALD